MMLHAIIIDDEYAGIRALKKMLESHTERITVIAETTNPAEGITMINRYRPDVVFLDVQMPQLNGFELLNEVNTHDFHLIFTTAHTTFALRALKINALDYLLKPIDPGELSATLTRIKKLEDKNYNAGALIETFKLQKERSASKIMLPTRDEVSYVTANELMYLEAQSNNCRVKLLNNSHITTNLTLKQYESKLCSEGTSFIRIHHSYIVNIEFAIRFNRDQGGVLIMSDGKSIPVSKQKKEQLFEMLNIKS